MRNLSKIITLSLALGASAAAFAGDVVVVGNPDSDYNLTEGDIRDAYLNANPDLTPFEMEMGSELHRDFHEFVTGRSDSQLQSFWSQETFTGSGTPPEDFSSAEDMKEAVSETDNSVGYLRPADVDDSVQVLLEQ